MAPRPKKPIVKLRIVSNVVGGPLTIETLGTKAQVGAKLDHYRLAWGDGAVQEGIGTPPLRLSHQYSENGDFAVQLTVWDSKNMSNAASLSASIWVNPPSPVPPDPPLPPTDTLTAADFTLDSIYTLPRGTGVGSEDTLYGTGLALRYEPSDGVNQVHLLSAAYAFGTYGASASIYEWRDQTSPLPGSPYNTGSYAEATIVKRYGNIFSGKRLVLQGGVQTELIGWLDGNQGLYFDPVDNRLYWIYGFGYSDEGGSDHIGYSTLNYGAGTGVGHGPWRINGQSWKAMMGGLVAIPSAFAAAHLGGAGVRLGAGFGGYFSLIASCDASLGPSLTAFTPPAGGAPESTALPGTALVGYWPVGDAPSGSNGKMTRPAYIIPGRPSADQTAWGPNKSYWNDRIWGGVWIHGPTKSGFVTMGNIGRDLNNYINSTIAAEWHTAFWAIYSEAQLASVVAGSAQRYAIQPEVILQSYPMHDPASEYAYAPPVSKTITSITSDPTKHVNGIDGTNTGALITTSTPHGFLVNDYVGIRGTASPGSYDQIWVIGEITSPTQFRIFNGNAGSELWSGIPSATGTAHSPCTGSPSSASANHTLGAAYDPLTKKLYVAVAKLDAGGGGKVMILRYSVNC